MIVSDDYYFLCQLRDIFLYHNVEGVARIRRANIKTIRNQDESFQFYALELENLSEEHEEGTI